MFFPGALYAEDLRVQIHAFSKKMNSDLMGGLVSTENGFVIWIFPRLDFKTVILDYESSFSRTKCACNSLFGGFANFVATS